MCATHQGLINVIIISGPTLRYRARLAKSMEDNNTEPTLDLTTRSSPAPEAMLIGGSTNSMDRGTLRVFDGDGSYKDYRINSGT